MRQQKIAAQRHGKVIDYTIGYLLRKYDAIFVNDISFPDGSIIPPDSRLQKSWSIRNSGSVTWNSATKLRMMWGSLAAVRCEVDVPFLAPGSMGTVTVELIAPSQPGQYESHWKMFHEGINFGDHVWCVVIVCPREILEPVRGECLQIITNRDMDKVIDRHTDRHTQTLHPEEKEKSVQTNLVSEIVDMSKTPLIQDLSARKDNTNALAIDTKSQSVAYNNSAEKSVSFEDVDIVGEKAGDGFVKISATGIDSGERVYSGEHVEEGTSIKKLRDVSRLNSCEILVTVAEDDNLQTDGGDVENISLVDVDDTVSILRHESLDDTFVRKCDFVLMGPEAETLDLIGPEEIHGDLIGREMNVDSLDKFEDCSDLVGLDLRVKSESLIVQLVSVKAENAADDKVADDKIADDSVKNQLGSNSNNTDEQKLELNSDKPKSASLSTSHEVDMEEVKLKCGSGAVEPEWLTFEFADRERNAADKPSQTATPTNTPMAISPPKTPSAGVSASASIERLDQLDDNSEDLRELVRQRIALYDSKQSYDFDDWVTSDSDDYSSDDSSDFCVVKMPECFDLTKPINKTEPSDTSIFTNAADIVDDLVSLSTSDSIQSLDIAACVPLVTLTPTTSVSNTDDTTTEISAGTGVNDTTDDQEKVTVETCEVERASETTETAANGSSDVQNTTEDVFENADDGETGALICDDGVQGSDDVDASAPQVDGGCENSIPASAPIPINTRESGASEGGVGQGDDLGGACGGQEQFATSPTEFTNQLMYTAISAAHRAAIKTYSTTKKFLYSLHTNNYQYHRERAHSCSEFVQGTNGGSVVNDNWLPSITKNDTELRDWTPPKDDFKLPQSDFKVAESDFKVAESEFKVAESDFKLAESSFKVEESGFKIAVKNQDFKVPTGDFKLPEDNFRVPDADYKPPTDDDVKILTAAEFEQEKKHKFYDTLNKYRRPVPDEKPTIDATVKPKRRRAPPRPVAPKPTDKKPTEPPQIPERNIPLTLDPNAPKLDPNAPKRDARPENARPESPKPGNAVGYGRIHIDYTPDLTRLAEMGFTDQDLNLGLLKKYKDIQRVVAELLRRLNSQY